MNKSFSLSILLIVLGMLSTACSTRWREADSGVEGQVIYDQIVFLSELSSVQSGSDLVNMEDVDELLDGGYIYYAGFPGKLGDSILDVFYFPQDFAELFSTQSFPRMSDLENIQAYFIANRVSGGSLDAILIIESYDKRAPDAPTVRVYTAEDYGSISDTGFSIDVQSADTLITLRSEDWITEDDLPEAIKLKVFDQDGDLRGQIGSMEGFSIAF